MGIRRAEVAWRGIVVAFLVALVVGPVPAAAAQGALAVEAVPGKVTPDSSKVTVRIANTGDGAVTAVSITAGGPPGVTATVEPAAIDSLAQGVSVLVTITVDGVPESRPAVLIVRATGQTETGGTAAATSVELVAAEPAASLALAGNNRLSDRSPADLVAVVNNKADVPAEVELRATAGRHVVRLAAAGGDVASAEPGEPLMITVPPRQAAMAMVQVEADRPLRRGTAALVVTATVRTPHGRTPVDVTASHDLEVALSADLLPGVIGVGSVLVIPGLVAVWAFLTVLHRDRRRIGLAAPAAAGQIWDNKLWLLAAAAASLGAAVVYAALGFADLLDSYTLGDIAVVTVAAGLAGAAVAAASVWWHRRDVPVVAPMTAPLAVLKAANKADGRMLRPVYRTTDGKQGLLVHTDRDAVVLTPQIEYTELDITQAVQQQQLGDAITGIEQAQQPEQKMRFGTDAAYLDRPTAAPGAVPVNAVQPMLKYVDDF